MSIVRSDPFLYAPPVVKNSGASAVPIDIDEVVATVVFRTDAPKGNAHAHMRFRMGNETGYPIFDFQQNIGTLVLNNQHLSPSILEALPMADGTESVLRVLHHTTISSSDNLLEFSYDLVSPGPISNSVPDPLTWLPSTGKLRWDFSFSDLYAGRYLGLWFPSNMIFDQFRFSLDLQIQKSPINHVLVSNGCVKSIGKNHWLIEYPDSFSALSPMLVVCPASELMYHSDAFHMKSGEKVVIDLYFELVGANNPNPHEVLQNIRTFMLQNEQSTGKYCHGNRYVAVIRENYGSMEYDGGTTSDLGSLKHEVFHSWYGRGIKPASQNDSWIDEGWTIFCTAPFGLSAIAFDTTQAPVLLSPLNPYNLVTPRLAYERGFLFFAGIAAQVGLETLLAAMKNFYTLFAGKMVTTKDLADHLYEVTGDASVQKFFDHFVYGIDQFSDGLS